MKKIFFFFSFFSLVFAFSTYDKYLDVGIGVCKSNKYNGVNVLSTDFGYKNDTDRIYLNLSNINYDTDNNLGIFSYSLNYDRFLFSKNNFKPFIGIGINFFEIGDDSGVYARKFGFNIKTGLTYSISFHWAANLKLDYMYVNHKDIKYTYGSTLNLEYQF